MNAPSLRWHIQRWHGSLLILLVGAMAATFFGYERRVRMERMERELSYTVSALIPRISPPGPLHGPRVVDRLLENRVEQTNRTHPGGQLGSATLRPIEEILADPAIYYILWDSSGNVARRSRNCPADVPYPKQDSLFAETTLQRRLDYLEAVHLVPNGQCLLAGIPMSAVHASLFRFGVVVFGGASALVAIGLGMGWWLVGRETRRITLIGETAERIAGGDLSERIHLPDAAAELQQLATVLNDTFAKLDTSFAQQVRFTADASHELRTPLTVILTKGQFALARERTPEKYRETITACLEAAGHMRRVVESLLELARFDSGEAALELGDHDLAEVAAEVLGLLSPLAEQKAIKLVSHLAPASARCDPHRIRQVMINLVANAIKHCPDGIGVTVSTTRLKGTAVLTVADEGHGVPEDDIPHIFDRFHRGGNAHEGDGRTGLGLAITKAIVVAHHGAITVENQPEGGALFRVILPEPES